MNILFLVPDYQNLYKPIITALEDKGHKVFTIFDVILKDDPYFIDTHKSIYKKIKGKIFPNANMHEKYWYDYIKNSDVLNKNKFDLFFCINGYSLDYTLIEFLKNKNKDLKTVLYLWDTNNYYYFNRHLPYFDKVYSFDWFDCKKSEKLSFLPFYWIPYKITSQENKYIMSIIGSDHDNRFYIVDKIAQILRQNQLPYYFKLFTTERKYRLKDKILYILYYFLRKKERLFDLKLRYGKIKSDLLTFKTIPQHEVMQIMLESEYILDTDRETQTGTTPRLIWALALNKKVITTNKNIKYLPFYNNKQIYIIDRINPNIDFIFNDDSTNCNLVRHNYIDQLKIDQWIKNFL